MSIPSYITLLGAEDVSRASGGMQTAAASMQSAADSIQWAFEQHQRFMDDWLVRYTDAKIAKLAARSGCRQWRY